MSAHSVLVWYGMVWYCMVAGCLKVSQNQYDVSPGMYLPSGLVFGSGPPSRLLLEGGLANNGKR